MMIEDRESNEVVLDNEYGSSAKKHDSFLFVVPVINSTIFEKEIIFSSFSCTHSSVLDLDYEGLTMSTANIQGNFHFPAAVEVDSCSHPLHVVAWTL